MIKKIVRRQLIETVEGIKSLPETGTHEYSDRIDELIADLRNVKHTLRSGKNRHKYRKESGNLQRAIEALRYLRRQSDRLINDENRKTDRLVERLSSFNIGGTVAIEKCDVAGTLAAMGIDNKEVQQALSVALTDFVPYYLCSATKEASRMYTEIFANSIKMFSDVMEKVYSEALDDRLNQFKVKDPSIKKFECLNRDNIFEEGREDFTILSEEDRKKKLKKKLKNIRNISPSEPYGIVDSIFRSLMDEKLRRSPEIAGMIEKMSAQFQKDISDAKNSAGGDPDETVKAARIGNDFLKGTIEIIKDYYEKDFGAGSFPRLGR